MKSLKEIMMLMYDDGVEINMKRIGDTKYIKVKVIQNLPGTEPENPIVRRLMNCTIVNTYKNSKKSGMKIITAEQLSFDFENLDQLGDGAGQPVNGNPVQFYANNDTAF